MKKLFIPLLLMVLVSGSVYAQDTKNSLQANILYGSKIETVGFGFTFNLTGKKHEFSPSLNVYLPKNDIKVREINFDYHRLYGIGNKIKVFPIVGFALSVWDTNIESTDTNETKFGVNLGIGGRYDINEKFHAGFQFKYGAMTESASQSVPMLTIAYKL